MDQKNGGDGQMWLAEPHGGAEWLVQMERDENPTDHAVDGVENPFPADGPERYGRHPGEKHEETDHAAAAKGLLEDDGEDARDDDDDDLRANGEDERDHDGDTGTGEIGRAECGA